MTFKNRIARTGRDRYSVRMYSEGKLIKATFHSLREAERCRDTLLARQVERRLGVNVIGRETVVFRQTHVYFIRAGEDGPVKIGTALNISERIGSLQSGNADRLVVLGAIPGGEVLELLLHERFAALRVTGREWFRPEAELLAFIDRHAMKPLAVNRGRRRLFSAPLGDPAVEALFHPEAVPPVEAV